MWHSLCELNVRDTPAAEAQMAAAWRTCAVKLDLILLQLQNHLLSKERVGVALGGGAGASKPPGSRGPRLPNSGGSCVASIPMRKEPVGTG